MASWFVIRALALAAILPLTPQSALAHPARDGAIQVAQISGGPHRRDPGPTASPHRPDPGFTPGLTLSFTLPTKPRTEPTRDAPVPDIVPGTVIFLLWGSEADPQMVGSQGGVTVMETVQLESLRRIMVVASLAPGDTPDAAIGRLSRLQAVAWAQPNHVYQSMAGATAWPRRFELQGLTRAEMARPAPGVVAMIDTPVALGHETLVGAPIQQRLFAGPAAPGAHGTAVAALMVGRGQISGSGAGARLVSLAAFQASADGATALSQTRHLAKALDAAAQLRPNVLNLSFGGPHDRLLDALLSNLDLKGVCIAAAAGNGGKTGRPPFPASHPAVLGVTAVDERLRIYPFATPGPQVDIAATGVDLTGAAPGGYRQVSGSSYATALVSGALLRTQACAVSRNPGAMRAAVAAAARDLGAPGRDDTFGAGLFRLPGAVP